MANELIHDENGNLFYLARRFKNHDGSYKYPADDVGKLLCKGSYPGHVWAAGIFYNDDEPSPDIISVDFLKCEILKDEATHYHDWEFDHDDDLYVSTKQQIISKDSLSVVSAQELADQEADWGLPNLSHWRVAYDSGLGEYWAPGRFWATRNLPIVRGNAKPPHYDTFMSRFEGMLIDRIVVNAFVYDPSSPPARFAPIYAKAADWPTVESITDLVGLQPYFDLPNRFDNIIDVESLGWKVDPEKELGGYGWLPDILVESPRNNIGLIYLTNFRVKVTDS